MSGKKEEPLVSLPVELTVADQTFLGIPIQHSWTSLYVLERLLKDRPNLKRFVEIGTGMGGLTIFFALHAMRRGAKTLTIDREEHMAPHTAKLTERMPVNRLVGSYSDPRILKIVAEFLDKPALIYCDNGNKIDEFRTYAPLLSPGDIILAHDYGYEIHVADIESTVRQFGLIPLYQETFDCLHTAILAYHKHR